MAETLQEVLRGHLMSMEDGDVGVTAVVEWLQSERVRETLAAALMNDAFQGDEADWPWDHSSDEEQQSWREHASVILVVLVAEAKR